jgi:septum formation protein
MLRSQTLPALDNEVIVLASASPRRSQLLTRAGVKYQVIPPDIDEERRPGEDPVALATRLAREKASSVAMRVGISPRRLVLGSDTVVVIDDEILGKPEDPEHAVQLLRRLVGHTHSVITGIAVVDSASHAVRQSAVTARVSMRPASDAEIRAYVATGEPLDKAGAYAIQGRGQRLVTELEGSESCVIGLPIDETLALLEEARRDQAKESR